MSTQLDGIFRNAQREHFKIFIWALSVLGGTILVIPDLPILAGSEFIIGAIVLVFIWEDIQLSSRWQNSILNFSTYPIIFEAEEGKNER
jgi:hypothetical protein